MESRLDNMEKLLENLSKGMQEIKNSQKTECPALQVNGVPLQQQSQVLGQTGKPQFGGARPKEQSLPPGGLGLRARSDSRERKRKAEEDLQQPSGQGQGQGQGQQGGWNDVVRGRRKVQYGTSQVRVAGGEAAPYDVFVGNTHPGSTDDIIKEVLVKVSENMSEEFKLTEPLEILEVECLTKPRTDGRPSWTRNWRVRVPNRFRQHMLRPEAYPTGWSSRRYFPARAARPPVAPLYPEQQQPDRKRPNLDQGQNGPANMDQ